MELYLKPATSVENSGNLAQNLPDHIWCAVSGLCIICHLPTQWVELNFEAPLCPEPRICTDAMWAQYEAALAGCPIHKSTFEDFGS